MGTVVSKTGYGKWSPLSLRPLLKFWLRGDLGITLNGSNVVLWADQSGNGNNFRQSIMSEQPTYSPSLASFNGRPGVVFSNSRLFTDLLTMTGGDYSFLFVYKATDITTTNQRLLDTKLLRIIVDHVSFSLSTAAGVWTGAYDNFGASSQIATAQALLYEFNGTTARLFRGGVGQVDGDQTIVSVSPISNLIALFSYYEFVQSNTNGELVEVIGCQGVLSNTQKNSLFSYTLARYGV
jgi:hypothetical protein